jgi:uncharacterized cupredoxin-like copper-binding protein
MTNESKTRASALALAAATALLAGLGVATTTLAHEQHGFSAGEPGNPKRPARTVEVVMKEADGKMLFVPDRVQVKRGEQIRCKLKNIGELDHEFLLATTAENLKHGEIMKKNPDMEHDEPNGKKVAPKKGDEILWRFTKAGTFEFSCLIPGHREAGMIGTVVVK